MPFNLLVQTLILFCSLFCPVQGLGPSAQIVHSFAAAPFWCSKTLQDLINSAITTGWRAYLKTWDVNPRLWAPLDPPLQSLFLLLLLVQ